MQITWVKIVILCLAFATHIDGSVIKDKAKGKTGGSEQRSDLPEIVHPHQILHTDQNLGRAGSQTSTLHNENCGVAAFAKSSSSASKTSFIPRIVNGTVAESGEWPWQAMILRYDTSGLWYGQVCGGTLIGTQWVLCAAHCFEGEPTWHTHVALGASLRDLTESTVKRVAVSSIHCHSSFDPGTFQNDICLLKLGGEISYTDYILPACLPENTAGPPTGENCVVTGWGDTSGTGTRDALREATVMIIDKDQCASWYSEDSTLIPDNHLCAGYPEGRVDTCQGDSGGPLVCPGANVGSTGSSYVVYGITSFGQDCARKERPGVYTDVAKYVDWIDDTIAANSATNECFSTPAIDNRSTITLNGTILRSPVEDEESWLYPADSDYYWDIDAPEGDTIQLEFTCFYQLEMDGRTMCYDYIKFSATSIGFERTHCGSEIPAPLLVNSNKARISFHSDSSRQSLGFVVKINFLRGIEPTIPNVPQTTATPETTISSSPTDSATSAAPTTPSTTVTSTTLVTTTNSAISNRQSNLGFTVTITTYFCLLANSFR